MEFKTTNTHAHRPVAILCVVAAILQVALAPQIALFGGRINFMLALTAVLAVSGDTRALVYVGFFAGLFYDFTSAAPVGLMALLLTLMGYGVAAVSRGIAPGPSAQAMRTVGAAILFVNLIYGLALFFMGIQGNLLVSLGVHGLVSSVLDILVAAVALAVVPTGDRGHGFTASRGPQSLGTLGGGRGKSRGTRFKGIR